VVETAVVVTVCVWLLLAVVDENIFAEAADDEDDEKNDVF
jgi:hypothetical protein